MIIINLQTNEYVRLGDTMWQQHVLFGFILRVTENLH